VHQPVTQGLTALPFAKKSLVTEKTLCLALNRTRVAETSGIGVSPFLFQAPNPFELDRAQNAGRQRVHLIQVLHLKTIPILLN
jgi:hypothetical protein